MASNREHHLQTLKDMGWLTPAQFWPRFSPTRIKLEKRKVIWSPPIRRIVPGLIKSEMLGVQPMAPSTALIVLLSVRDLFNINVT